MIQQINSLDLELTSYLVEFSVAGVFVFVFVLFAIKTCVLVHWFAFFWRRLIYLVMLESWFPDKPDVTVPRKTELYPHGAYMVISICY